MVAGVMLQKQDAWSHTSREAERVLEPETCAVEDLPTLAEDDKKKHDQIARQMALADEIMRADHEILCALAK